MFLTGYIAGVHFVQTLAKLVAGEVLPRISSVGRTSDGDMEVLEHGDLEEAFEYVVVVLYPYAVVTVIEGDLYRWYVCRPDVPDDMVATIEMRAAISDAHVTTTTPRIASPGFAGARSTPEGSAESIDGEDFDNEGFFDGFAAGIDASEHPFQIAFGTLDVMARLLLEQAAIPEELR